MGSESWSQIADVGLYLAVFAVAVAVLFVVGRDTDDEPDTDEVDHWEHLRTCDQPCCGAKK